MSTNREIKFRNFWNGNMIYNHSFCLTIDGQLSVLREDGEWDLAKDNEFQLMQYTGLNDKHNNPIYEEDICTAKFKNKSGEVTEIKGKIIMDDFMWCIDCVDGIGNDIFSINRIHDIKIIGNAKENPELLQQ